MDLITPIIEVISRLCDCTARHTSYIHELEGDLNTLQALMEELKDIRNDVRRTAQTREECTNQIDGWLRRAEAMKTEVYVILTEGSKEVEERCLGGCCPKHCATSYKLGKKVVRKIREVEELKSKGGGFDIVAEALPPSPVQEMPLVPTTGMDLMFEKVWSCISEETVGVIGIYGMGGVGKTTLLNRINNEFLDGGNLDFDVVIWVVVSKEVHMTRIQDDVAKRIGLSLDPYHNLKDNAARIYSALSKKKFVLLLDDIWDRVDLVAIGIPHSNIKNMSKVVFTTRSEVVCGLMESHKKIKMECLEWPEAWNLFQEKLGDEALNAHHVIPAIAQDVAKECAGLPLALITVGRAMSSKKTPQEWKHAITILKKSASELLGMAEKVYPVLKFSYDSLHDDTIRSCFLYFSLFPEDYSIDIEQLIRYWIGEGFLDGFDDMDEARNKGYHYVGLLKQACLLESGKDSLEEKVKMHDVLRDFALWIACDCGKKKDNFLVRAGVMLSEAPEVRKWREAKKISLMNNSIQTLGIETPTCPNLLTLFISRNLDLNISNGFFQYMHVLRVLDLSETKIHEFPMSIVELVELQYLGLSATLIRELPIEMKNLIKLKCLDLSHTEYLEFIPCGTLSRLSKLQVLDLTGSRFGEWEAESYGGQDDGNDGASIEELECLKDLKYLSIIITNAATLKRLLGSDKFTRCAIRLYIRQCHDLTSFLQSTPEILESICLPNIREVDIDNCEVYKSLSWLRGATALELLSVTHCYGLEAICDSMIDGHFPNLRRLYIVYCRAMKDLAWLHGATNLESLEVNSCYSLEEVCDGAMDGCFSNLRKVVIENCRALKDLSFLRCALYLASLHIRNCMRLELICDGIKDGFFPNLHKVDIYGCNALKDLSWLRGAPNLDSLEVSFCMGLEVICDRMQDGCFSTLHKVSISNCSALNDLSWLCGAPNLKSLYVSDCKSLKVIQRSGANTGVEENQVTFSCIKSVFLANLPELKEIPWSCFPNDTVAMVQNCPKVPLRTRTNIKL